MLKNPQQLNKQEIKSIGLDNVLEIEKEEEAMEQDEIFIRANSARNFYNLYFEKVIKLLLLEQLRYLGTEAENTEQLLFTRGKISGLDLIDSWFKQQLAKDIEKHKKDETTKFN